MKKIVDDYIELHYWVGMHMDGSLTYAYDSLDAVEGYKRNFPTVKIIELVGKIKKSEIL